MHFQIYFCLPGKGLHIRNAKYNRFWLHGRLPTLLQWIFPTNTSIFACILSKKCALKLTLDNRDETFKANIFYHSGFIIAKPLVEPRAWVYYSVRLFGNACLIAMCTTWLLLFCLVNVNLDYCCYYLLYRHKSCI